MDGLTWRLDTDWNSGFWKFVNPTVFSKFIYVVCNVWYALGDIFVWYEAVILSFTSKFTSSFVNKFDALLISDIWPDELDNRDGLRSS